MKFPRPVLAPDAPPTGGAPAPTTIVPPGAPDPTSVVQLSRAEYDKLVGATSKVSTLESRLSELSENWDKASVVFSREEQDPTKLMAATRHVLAKAGWTPEQIEQSLAETPAPDDTPTPTPRRGARTPEPNPEIENLQRQVESLQQDHTAARLTQLQGLFGTAVSGALDTNPEIATLVANQVRLADLPEADAKKYREDLFGALREEVDKTLRERLRVRKQQSGNAWRDDWIREEAVEAAKAVHGRFRRFAADPSKLGRAPGTNPDIESIHDTKPVEAPTYKAGMSTDAANQALKGFMVDQFLRMAQPPAGTKA